MRRFELIEPATIEEAVRLLDPEDPGVRALAGATALIPMMKSGVFQPTRLISLRRLDGELRGVRDDSSGGLRIGAMTTLSELERSHSAPRVGAGDHVARCARCRTSASATWPPSGATSAMATRTWICLQS